MKKPAYLEIMDYEMHYPKPSRKARRAVVLNRIKSIFRNIAKIVSLPLLVALIYSASIYHQPIEQPKIVKITLDQQIDRFQAIAYLNGRLK